METVKTTMVIGGKTITVETGHTKQEWAVEFGDYGNGDCWDFPIEELIDGTVEPDEDIIYWCIDGRMYETTL